MNILGLSYGYHDASATLVIDGEVRASSSEAAFSRQKHDAGFPRFAIEYCLDAANIGVDDLDHIVFHEDPHTKFSRVLTASLAPFPYSRKEFVGSVKSWLGKKLWAIPDIALRLKVPAQKISFLGHHFSHAAQAFMGSGFESSAILVVDAVGDWASTALYRGEWKNGRPHIERIEEIAFPNSLGLLYSAVTAYLGFAPNDSECSTMALAAFGKPTYLKAMRAVVQEDAQGLYTLDQSYFHFTNFYRGPVTQKFIDIFGPPRKASDFLPFNCWEKSTVSAEHQRFADIAYSLQTVMEERVLALSKRLFTAFPSNNLCFAGGVAFNCVLNQKLLLQSPFQNLYIPPDPGDGGTSIGTALYFSGQTGGGSIQKNMYTPYLGSTCEESDAIQMIPHLDTDHFLPYLLKTTNATSNRKWRHQTYTSGARLTSAVAHYLKNDSIVGWFQGKMEIGPRALGHRSILIRPDRPSLAARLSHSVKERAAFRPYALSMTQEAAQSILDCPAENLSHYSWMQYAVPVSKDFREKVKCGIHVDGTTRPQISAPKNSPLFHQLLIDFEKESGIAALINTSFNPSGYPIVCSVLEAMAVFARTDMDVLVVNNTVIWKEL